MKRAIRGLLAAVVLLTGAACTASAGAGAAGGRTRSNVLTLEEIQQRGQYSNLYDLIQTLRPRWLRSQGPDTLIGQQGAVQVVMDGNRMGSVQGLRNMAVSGVTTIEWVAPIDASARYGLDHSHGAIVISTRPVH